MLIWLMPKVIRCTKKKKRKVTYLNFSFYFYNKRLMTNKHRIPLLNIFFKKKQHLGTSIIPFSTSIAKIIWVYYRRINSIFLHKKIEKFVILMFLIKSSIIQRPMNFRAGLHHGILVYKNLSPTSKHEVSHKCHCVTRRWCDGRKSVTSHGALGDTDHFRIICNESTDNKSQESFISTGAFQTRTERFWSNYLLPKIFRYLM